MESNLVTLSGIIEFEPINKTKKHEKQASWKRIAMVMMEGDVSEYYAWFLKRRFNLDILKPLRNSHISFINDHIRDINNGEGAEEYRDELWNKLKEKWDGFKVDVVLDLNPRSDGKTWWFNIPEEHRKDLHGIRAEIGLQKPYYGLHMTIGNVHPKQEYHSDYILTLLKKGLAK
jgi:hypothetical protein